MCFDLLHFAGLNLRSAPYGDRRRYLAQCLLPAPHVQLVHFRQRRRELYAAALASGYEGIVAKRLDSTYQPGCASRAWLQGARRVRSAEFLIGGYTRGKGAREPLGALLLGYCDGKAAALRRSRGLGAGRGDDRHAAQAQRASCKRTRSPFAEKPPLHRPTTWLEPRLVAEVTFSEWTPGGLAARAGVRAAAR